MAVTTKYIASDGEKFDDLRVAELYETMMNDPTSPYMTAYARRELALWLCNNFTIVPNLRHDNELSFAASN